MEGVLQVGEFLADAMGAVVVDKSDSANDDCIGCGCLLTDKTIANEVSECFGAIGIATLPDGSVETLQQIGIDGNANAA